MADEARPLSDQERAELEALRAEKAAREQAARDRAELEALRAEQMAQPAAQPATQAAPATRPARATAAESEEDRRIREARDRGAKLMEPDDDLRMPVGQKVVLAVLAVLVIIIVVMTRLVG